MFRSFFFLRLFLIALTLSASLLSAAESPGDPATDYRTNLEKETFQLINQYRSDNKFPPLKWSSDIAVVARGHSKDMSTGDVDFGHEGFGKRVKLLKTEMVGLVGAGENVLKTDNPDQVAQAAVTIWLHSPHHLENIRGDFNYSGIGVWVDEHGMIYFTQFFVKLAPQAQAAAPATPPATILPFVYLANPNTR